VRSDELGLLVADQLVSGDALDADTVQHDELQVACKSR